jgi:hypothetical protein
MSQIAFVPYQLRVEERFKAFERRASIRACRRDEEIGVAYPAVEFPTNRNDILDPADRTETFSKSPVAAEAPSQFPGISWMSCVGRIVSLIRMHNFARS